MNFREVLSALQYKRSIVIKELKRLAHRTSVLRQEDRRIRDVMKTLSRPIKGTIPKILYISQEARYMQQRIYDALTVGPLLSVQIADHLGERAIKMHGPLKALEKQGLIEREGLTWKRKDTNLGMRKLKRGRRPSSTSIPSDPKVEKE